MATLLEQVTTEVEKWRSDLRTELEVAKKAVATRRADLSEAIRYRNAVDAKLRELERRKRTTKQVDTDAPQG